MRISLVSLIELVILFGGREGKLWNVLGSILPIEEKYSLNMAATFVGRDTTLLSLLRVIFTAEFLAEEMCFFYNIPHGF